MQVSVSIVSKQIKVVTKQVQWGILVLFALVLLSCLPVTARPASCNRIPLLKEPHLASFLWIGVPWGLADT